MSDFALVIFVVILAVCFVISLICLGYVVAGVVGAMVAIGVSIIGLMAFANEAANILDRHVREEG